MYGIQPYWVIIQHPVIPQSPDLQSEAAQTPEEQSGQSALPGTRQQ